MQITVKRLDLAGSGRPSELTLDHVETSWTVKRLKKRIEQADGPPAVNRRMTRARFAAVSVAGALAVAAAAPPLAASPLVALASLAALALLAERKELRTFSGSPEGFCHVRVFRSAIRSTSDPCLLDSV